MPTTTARICTTCARPKHDPWRELEADGSVRFGCVDAFHGQVDDWSRRPEAVAIMAGQRLGLDGTEAK